MTTSFSSKLKAAYENGRMDFIAGAPCDAKTVMEIYSELEPRHLSLVVMAWTDGWIDQMNDNLTQALPEGALA